MAFLAGDGTRADGVPSLWQPRLVDTADLADVRCG
jgi:hypothetical protein